MAINNGVGTAWGIVTTALGPGYSGIAFTALAWAIEEESMESSMEEDQHYDSQGAVQGCTWYRPSKTARVKGYPMSTTLALAETAGTIPTLGQEFFINSPDPEMTGVWSIRGASKSRTSTSKAFIELTLVRWGDNANNVSHGTPSNNRISSPVA